MARRRKDQTTVIIYEGGIPVARWKMWPRNIGTEIEEITLKGFVRSYGAHNLLMIVEGLVGDMWRDDVKDLIKLIDNDAADDEFGRRRDENDEPPF